MCTSTSAAIFASQHLPAHCAKGSRQYKWRTYDGKVSHNMLGGVRYLSPAEGVVVEQKDGWTAIKTGRSDFDLVETQLLSQPVAIGDKVALTYYQLRRFDGQLADGSEDPAVNGCRTMMLTGAKSTFPVRWDADPEIERYAHEGDGAEAKTTIINPYLIDLIRQLQETPSSNPLRKVVNVIIDAYRGHLEFVDPPAMESCNDDRTRWPSICMVIKGKKDVLSLAIRYDRGIDYYAVDLNGHAHVQDISFDELGKVIEEIVDAEDWLKAKVTLLKAAPRRKAA